MYSCSVCTRSREIVASSGSYLVLCFGCSALLCRNLCASPHELPDGQVVYLCPRCFEKEHSLLSMYFARKSASRGTGC